MDTTILPRVYIYIIYPSNYDVENINTRQFYIGSTYNSITDTKHNFYNDLYNGTTEKKIDLMRKYMTFNDINPSKEKSQQLSDNERFWQFRPIFIGYNCCTKALLKSLEGLYIYYYYSVLNDEDIEFKPSNITPNEIIFFNKIGIIEHLYKCYSPFEYEDLIYDVNPYTLIKKDTTLFQYKHIYKEICERTSIPKFNNIDNLTFQYIYEENIYIDDNNNDINIDAKHPIYKIMPDNKYKCGYCNKEYENYTKHIYNHLLAKHKYKYHDDFKQFKQNENNIPIINRT